MKQIAFLEYSFMFDPSETWSNGVQFENQLASFFGAYGFEARVLATAGGTGRRIILIERTELTQPKEVPKAPPKKIETVPPKDFKEFQNRGVPKKIVDQTKAPPQLKYKPGGYQLRQKIK